MESISHLFLFGEIAKKVWGVFSVGMLQNYHALTVLHVFSNWWKQGNSKTVKGWLMYMLPTLILWNIWKAHNKNRFDNVHMLSSAVIDAMNQEVKQLYVAANACFPAGNVDKEFFAWLGISPIVEKASTLLVHWIAPPITWAKLNCNGASKSKSQTCRRWRDS